MGTPGSGHTRQLTIGRTGGAGAILGSAGSPGAQRSARGHPFMGHGPDRGARRARGALLVGSFVAIGAATTAAGRCRTTFPRVDAAGGRAAAFAGTLMVAAR